MNILFDDEAGLFYYNCPSSCFLVSSAIMSSVMAARSYFGHHPQSWRAALSSNDRGQESALAWRKSGMNDTSNSGTNR